MEEGVRIHAYTNAMIVVKGTLIVNGSLDSMVTFQGARLESFYEDLPGQWFGIVIIRGSTNSMINYAEIRNALYGITVGSIDLNDNMVVDGSNIPDILVTNTIIRDAAISGIFGFFGAITGENCLIYNCGQYNVQLEYGGYYDFTHCTFANFGTNIFLDHEKPVLRMYNYYEDPNGVIRVAGLNATFNNTIIYGTGTNEYMELEIGTTIDSMYSYVFTNCLLQSDKSTSDPSHFVSVIRNQNPQFIDYTKNNYGLRSISPCNNTGKPGVGILTSDLNGLSRDAVPDIGAFETGD